MYDDSEDEWIRHKFNDVVFVSLRLALNSINIKMYQDEFEILF